VSDTSLHTFLAPLSEDEKKRYKEKCKVEGLTSQGAIRKLILEFIRTDKKKTPC
jgi:hypothetical protein